MTALSLVALLAYTFGAFAFGAIFFLWAGELSHRGWGASDTRLGTRQKEVDGMNGVMFALAFLWFCCNIALMLCRVISGTTPWALDVAAVALAYMFPPIIMHLTWAEVAHGCAGRMSRAWRDVLWPVYAVTVIVPAAGIAVLVLPGTDAQTRRLAGDVIGIGLSVSFLVAAAYSIAIIARYGNARGARSRQSRRWTLALFGLMAVLFVIIFAITLLSGDGRPMDALTGIVEVAAKSLPLVFIFVGTYNENRFQFFDLFVKRGASMVVTLAALTASFAALLPILRVFARSWAAPWVFAVILLPTALAIPWMNRRVGDMLDRRWLGRRYNAVDAVTHFIGELRSATTEEQLRLQARRGLEEIFGARADVIVGDTSTAADPADQEIQVRSGDRVVGRFVLGPRASDAPYFSQDIALLTSLADVFAHVLENLHLQERRLEQEQRTQELSLHASRSELKALRAQINPHFLFNALNSIAGLIHRDPAVADRTIEQLADVFRYALRGAENEWAVLDDELEFVRAYLEVERARFGDRLHTEVRVAESARGARLPTMMVQTLVENAVKHGAASVRGRAIVEVDAREDSGRLAISVSDNGPGFREGDAAQAPSSRARGGYGLANIRQRLEGYFGTDGALTVRRDLSRGVTIVSVALPLLRDEPRPRMAAAEHGR